jgi:tRNA(Ile)-lysidine synthase
MENAFAATIQAAIKTYQLDQRPFVIGYSGGLDSTVLLHALASLSHVTIRAVHMHHGLHANADSWSRHCESICTLWNIAFEVRHIDVNRDSGLGIEAAARDARYQAFASTLQKDEVLFTAHHQNDQAETLLLRLLRASGSQGLAGMQAFTHANGVAQLRPFLTLSRATLLTYAQQHDLQWIEDPSNAHMHYDRNFIRSEIIPALESRWPQVISSISRSAELLREEQQCLQQQAAHFLAGMQSVDPSILEAKKLLALSAPWRAQVLRHWVNTLQQPPLPATVLQQIENELTDIDDDSEAMVRWEHTCIRRWRDYFFCTPAYISPPPDWHYSWNDTQPVTLPDQSRWGWLSLNAPSIVSFNQILAYFSGPLHLAYRKGGEKIQLPNRQHRSHLKQSLQAIGIPPWQRQQMPLLSTATGECLSFGDVLISEKLQAFQQMHELRFTRLNAAEALSLGHLPFHADT